MPKLAPVLLLLGWAALPSLPWRPHLPVWAERWLYNPRERTAGAIEALENKDAERAVDLTDTALRLAPDDPLPRFNSGTAQLAAGHERRAMPLLEKSARDAAPGLAPAAHYNLGNARLAAGDAAGAVAAYKQALRLVPDDANAKHNLEIALREHEKQRRGLQGSPRGSRGNRKDQQDPSGSRGSQNPNDQDPRRSDRDDQGKSEQPGQGQPQAGQRPRAPGQEGRPRFQDQPEMSAREAAALLQSVENLERQQRRDQAAKRARQRAATGKDW